MKRIIGYSAFTVLILFAAATVAFPQQVTNAITAARLQAASWTFAVAETFAGGARFTATTTAAPGAGTYLRKDADTGCWQEWQDGTLGWQLCADGVVPPDCTANGPREFGKFCKDQASGEVRMMTSGGVVALTGSAR